MNKEAPRELIYDGLIVVYEIPSETEGKEPEYKSHPPIEGEKYDGSELHALFSKGANDEGHAVPFDHVLLALNSDTPFHKHKAYRDATKAAAQYLIVNSSSPNPPELSGL